MATTPRNRFDAGALADARGGVVRRPAAVAAPPLRWPLLPLPDADGVLQWPSIERCVADAIRIVLATRPGEQLQQPRFGVGLEDELAAPNTVARRAPTPVAKSRTGKQVRQIRTAVQPHPI